MGHGTVADLQAFKAACPLVRAQVPGTNETKSGTGFVVAESVVATAAHVVDSDKGRAVECEFGSQSVSGIVEAVDRDDHALIRLNQPIRSVNPLSLAVDCADFSDFISYGYPAAAGGAGLVMRGEIYDARGAESRGVWALQIHSPDVASGMATPINGFSGSPVMVDNKVVGHLWKIISDPSNPGRPAYGLVWGAPAAHLIKMLGTAAPGLPGPGGPAPRGPSAPQRTILANVLFEYPDKQAPTGKVRPSVLVNQIRAAETAESVQQAFELWQKNGYPENIGIAECAARLIDLGNPALALQMIERGPDTLRLKQLKALALDGVGRRDESIQILLQLEQVKDDEYAEGRGILGGRYKKEWLDTRDERYLDAAYKVYLDAYERTRNSYPGINAASLSFSLKQPEQGKKIAAEVLTHLDEAPAEQLDQWQLATKAEAYLLLGDLDQANTWYQKAVSAASGAQTAIETMRVQAKRNLSQLGLQPEAFDKVFDRS